MENRTFTCQAMEESIHNFCCCTSCHDEWDRYGYDCLGYEREGIKFNGCCRFIEYIRELTDGEWQILKAKLLEEEDGE